MILIIILCIMFFYETDSMHRGQLLALLTGVVNDFRNQSKASTKSDEVNNRNQPQQKPIPTEETLKLPSITEGFSMNVTDHMSRDIYKKLLELIIVPSGKISYDFATTERHADILLSLNFKHYDGTPRQIQNEADAEAFLEKAKAIIKDNSYAFLIVYRDGQPYAYTSIFLLSLLYWGMYSDDELNDSNLEPRHLLGNADFNRSRSEARAPHGFLLHAIVFPRGRNLKEKRMIGGLVQEALAYHLSVYILLVALFKKDLSALVAFSCTNHRFNVYFRKIQLNAEKIARDGSKIISLRAHLILSHIHLPQPGKAV